MENRIKEQQLDLFSDRTSNHYFDDNPLRLWFSSFAYILLNALREQLLHHTKLADARVGTIRTQLVIFPVAAVRKRLFRLNWPSP